MTHFTPPLKNQYIAKKIALFLTSYEGKKTSFVQLPVLAQDQSFVWTFWATLFRAYKNCAAAAAAAAAAKAAVFRGVGA